MKDILIVDGQVLTEIGIIQIISELNFNALTGTCHHYEHLEKLISRLKPELLIIDPFFGHILTLSDLAKLEARFTALRVLITYDGLQRAELIKILDTGIKNLLSKTASRHDIIASLNAAMLNEKYLCLQTKQILFGPARSIETTPIPALSPREKEIIHLIADGLPDNAIAQKLFLSFHTIRTHRKNITKKLGFSLKNAAELIWLISYLNDFI